MKFSHNATPAFKQWAIPYYSWVDEPEEQDIESHEMAWQGCKGVVLDILKKNTANIPMDKLTVLISEINKV